MTRELKQALEAFRDDPQGSVIVTDVDGTIAPIVANPSEARVPSATMDALRQLTGTFLGIGVLSGRALDDLTRMVDLPGVFYVGNHGVEIQSDQGRSLDPEVLAALPRVAKLRKALAEEPEVNIAGVLVEDKEYAIALHYRGVKDKEQIAEIERCTERLAMGLGLTLLRGKMMRELRPFGAGGKDRGIATIIKHVEQSQGQKVKRIAYFGDDITDIDAFRYLGELDRSEGITGISIAVTGGDDQAAEVLEAADFTIEGPQSVAAILASLTGGNKKPA